MTQHFCINCSKSIKVGLLAVMTQLSKVRLAEIRAHGRPLYKPLRENVKTEESMCINFIFLQIGITEF
jgi:hypothetical protein